MAGNAAKKLREEFRRASEAYRGFDDYLRRLELPALQFRRFAAPGNAGDVAELLRARPLPVDDILVQLEDDLAAGRRTAADTVSLLRPVLPALLAEGASWRSLSLFLAKDKSYPLLSALRSQLVDAAQAEALWRRALDEDEVTLLHDATRALRPLFPAVYEELADDIRLRAAPLLESLAAHWSPSNCRDTVEMARVLLDDETAAALARRMVRAAISPDSLYLARDGNMVMLVIEEMASVTPGGIAALLTVDEALDLMDRLVRDQEYLSLNLESERQTLGLLLAGHEGALAARLAAAQADVLDSARTDYMTGRFEEGAAHIKGLERKTGWNGGPGFSAGLAAAMMDAGLYPTLVGLIGHARTTHTLTLRDLSWLDAAAARRLATGLRDGGHVRAFYGFHRLLGEIDPALQADIRESCGAPAVGTVPDIGRAMAPIIDGTGAALRDFVTFFETVPHETMGRAQADMLNDVWDALAAADPALAPMDRDGRADIPFDAQKLHRLYMDVCRYLCVVQTQMPAILPSGMDAAQAVRDVGAAAPGPLEKPAVCETRYVRGSDTALYRDPEGGEILSSRFGFMSLRKTETRTADGVELAQQKLLAMPVITIDDGVFRTTMDHGGADILRHLQHIAGIFNHDYFHHLSGRIIGPYFSQTFFGGEGASLNQSRTPYAVMLGESRITKGTDPRSRQFTESYAAEQSERFRTEKYSDERWKAFGAGQPYEFHALHLHNVLYRDFLDKGPTGDAMRGHVAGYIDGVAALADGMAAAGAEKSAIDKVKIYYANMLTFHLLRVVPYGHPLMNAAEDAVTRLDIDPQAYAAQVALARERQEERWPGTLGRMAAQTALPLEKIRNPAAMTAGECARASAFFAAERVLNPIYKEKYQEPRSYALSAMRQYVSVIQRDMQMIEHRGGMAAYDSMMAAKQRPRAGDGPGDRAPRADGPA